jgi:hypothetical protein
MVTPGKNKVLKFRKEKRKIEEHQHFFKYFAKIEPFQGSTLIFDNNIT